MDAPLITNDAIVLGILMVILGLVFWTHSLQTTFWRRFYTFVPSLLLCYFLPSLLSTFGLISGDNSQLYFISSRFLLPTSLILLTISIDLPGVLRLGPKAIIMFLTGTVGVVIGGPLAIMITSVVSPETVGGEGPMAVWRGMATVAGSWIGGGANQAAMLETFEVDQGFFSAFVAVDVIVANIWMACLLFAAGRHRQIDAATGADSTAIDDLRERVAAYQAQISRIPSLTDTMVVIAVGFGLTGLAHLLSGGFDGGGGIAGLIRERAPVLEQLSLGSTFFWLIVIATTGGVFLSFTRARLLEGVGASRLGSAMLYVLVASIGMKMNLRAIFENTGLFVVGLIWIAIHAGLLIVVAKLIKAPIFFLAVGSQANIGGAASAPIVASAFHPALAPVGVLLAVVGYALGTYAAWFCGVLMSQVAPLSDLCFRRAGRDDLAAIVAMLADDELGATREAFADPLPQAYRDAFEAIESDPNQLLAVAVRGKAVVGTLQLTTIPYLTYRGRRRAQIEAVRVAAAERGAGVGRALIEWAVEQAREQGCHVVQLTTDKRRPAALRFYERIGFEATHEGMKLHLERG